MPAKNRVLGAIAGGMCLLGLFMPAAAQSSGGAHAAPQARAVRAEPQSRIRIDGRLDESAWSAAQPATSFIQFDPSEGSPATQQTEVRFLFDEQALYIGARMKDDQGARGVRTRLARRDQLQEGDYIEIIFDTFHDHTGRTIFTLNPSGARADAGQASSYADPSWDPVWESSTQIDAEGWTAELRIPFSQLRFPTAAGQTWGLQVWRYVERLNETSMWSPWGRQDVGGPQRFGHLEGLEIQPNGLGIEVLPYVVTRSEFITPTPAGTPLREPREVGVRAGADVKALLSSTLTLDATFNPDFGQVEVDPAVVNLSAFETFFEEKRPFFIEGSGLFGFGGFSCYFCSNVSSMSLFYSRRVGRRPQGSVSNARYEKVPDNSTILGAAKVTGRTAGGLQIGVMNALTSAEDAIAIDDAGQEFRQEVEPLTNYFVGRVRKNYRDGNVTVGAIATSVVRNLRDDALRDLLPSRAEAVGLDWSASWKDRTYNFMGNFAVSNVVGNTSTMSRIQQASARYFHRPDRQHGDNGLFSDRYDTGLESLRGYGGYMRLAKIAGSWLAETTVNYRSPGFETNDAAFLTRADYIWMNANVLRVWNRPTRYYRQMDVTVGAQQQYNFDGDLTDRQFHGSFYIQVPSLWSFSTFAIRRPQVDDDRMTRGGPVVRRTGSWYWQVNVNSDSRKPIVVSAYPSYSRADNGASGYSIGASARIKPASNIALSVGPNFSRTGSATQFVQKYNDPSATHFFGQRVIFSSLIQYSLSMDTRLTATFSPTLTLELFGQPFVSTGDYYHFKEFVGPRTEEKVRYDDQQISAVNQDGRAVAYSFDPDRDPATAAFSFDNPDFNFRSLRGNAVLRWEYRPGSTLFLVWQQERSGTRANGDFEFRRDADAVFRERPDNIFLVKMTYWFGK